MLDRLCYALFTALPWAAARRRWVERLLLPRAGSYAFNDAEGAAEGATEGCNGGPEPPF